MTAEMLKSFVREYASQEFPGWDVASITISRGPGEKPEALIVTPGIEVLTVTADAACDPSLLAGSPH